MPHGGMHACHVVADGGCRRLANATDNVIATTTVLATAGGHTADRTDETHMRAAVLGGTNVTYDRHVHT